MFWLTRIELSMYILVTYPRRASQSVCEWEFARDATALSKQAENSQEEGEKLCDIQR